MYRLSKLKPPKTVRLPVASKGRAKPAGPGIDPYESGVLPIGSTSNASANPYDITTDPGYQAALASQKSGLAQLEAALLEAKRQAVIRFGDPALAQALGFSLSGVDAQAASANPYSTLAGLSHSHELRQRALINHLAATGGIFSGDTGYRTGEENSVYGGQVYDARQALLDAIGKATQDELDHKNALQAATDAAARAAWSHGVQSYA